MTSSESFFSVSGTLEIRDADGNVVGTSPFTNQIKVSAEEAEEIKSQLPKQE